MADAKLAHNLNDALRAFQTIPADALRPALGRLVEVLIEAMDQADDDPDLEPADEADDTDKEPSLGSFDGLTNQVAAWEQCSWYGNDCELDDCDFEEDARSWGLA
jgi:hypothetical protein